MGDLGSSESVGLLAALNTLGLKELVGMSEVVNLGGCVAAADVLFSDGAIEGKTILSFTTTVLDAGSADTDEAGACFGLFGI